MYELSELFVYKFVFIAELLVGMHLFSFRRNKRSKYPLRLVLGILACMAVGFAYPIASFSAWYSSLMFLALFFVCAASLLFTYDVSVKWAFFLSVSAYTTQHFAHELFSLVANAAGLVSSSTMGMYGSGPIEFSPTSARMWFAILVYVEAYLFSYWLLYKTAGRKINREDVSINKFSLALIAALILLVDIVMNAVAVYITDGYSKTYVFLTCVYNLVCCVLILYIQVGMCVRKNLERELETVSFLLHQSEEQFTQSKENVNLLNLKCHDLKHMVREYAGKRDIGEEYICDLENIINIYDSPVKTGNGVLDLILTEKSLACRRHEINLTCLADCSRLGFIGDTDLYGLFGNIIDNAMEAVMKLDDREKRNINVIVKNVNSFISIEVQNYYAGELKLDENGIPITTKADKNYHGYGFKSVCMIIEKYGGDINVTVDNEIFALSILFPVVGNGE